ncbi:Pristinamycin IIA synthase subunit A [Methylobacterium adhaesivum]|nr:Pristinamycin IIA synthase subunit A [Methylobacterium adhaesivum]
MSRDRRLHLVAFMRPVGIHTAWWRHSGGWPDANFHFERLATFALRRSATVTSFDPLTLRPALAVLTERIGLIATASTTCNEPYHVVRRFASLAHISKGRAGWNLVTSGNPDEASPGPCRGGR